MCDFLTTEVWWMETIISSLITAGVVLVGYILTYNFNIVKIKDKLSRIEKDIGEKKNELAVGHNGLSAEHKGLSSEHSRIIELQNLLQNTSQAIKAEQQEGRHKLERLLEKEAVQEERYRLLSSDKQRLVVKVQDGSQAFNALIDEIERLNQLCQQQQQTLEQYVTERDTLIKERVQQDIAYKQLEQKCLQLERKYEQLLSFVQDKGQEIDR